MATNQTADHATTASWETTPDVSVIAETQYRVYDSLIATGLCFCFLIGLPGNCLALSYFLQEKKKNLSNLLYIAASSIDIGSSIIHFPVTVNWFNERHPGLLLNKDFCSGWYFTLIMLQQSSIFVVMLLSLTRAIAILFPFYLVNTKAALISVLVYIVYQGGWNVLKIFFDGEYYYGIGFGYCDFYSMSEAKKVYMVNYSVCTGMPPVIVFVALILSISRLRRQKLTKTSQKNNKRSSLTIVYFSALFLVCNILTFINSAIFTFYFFFNITWPGPIYKNKFMFFYSWLLSEIFCTVLNASLNPVLYLWRMKRMKSWLKNLFTFNNRNRSFSTVIINLSTSSRRNESEI